MSSSPAPESLGSVSGAPNLPAGFTDTFTSRYVDTGDVRLHAVTGGEGPPLLLVHGWPETWYYWRLVMPALARDFSVVAVDQRGIGLSDKPADGYDTGTAARDLVALMEALGHQRFAMVGVDTGMLDGLNEELIRGKEDRYFGFQFAKGGHPLPEYAEKYYIDMLTSDPDSLRGSFGQYRAWDTNSAQNAQRKEQRLTLPVLAIGGAKGIGEGAANAMKLVADDVQTVIIPDCGHWLAEEAPEQMLAALTVFLAPYRPEYAVAHNARPHAVVD